MPKFVFRSGRLLICPDSMKIRCCYLVYNVDIFNLTTLGLDPLLTNGGRVAGENDIRWVVPAENNGSSGDDRAGTDSDALENYGVGPDKNIVANVNRAGSHEGFLLLEGEPAFFEFQSVEIMVENADISAKVDMFSDLNM